MESWQADSMVFVVVVDLVDQKVNLSVAYSVVSMVVARDLKPVGVGVVS